MTFPARLTELLEKATKGPWVWDGVELWHFGLGYGDDADPHRYVGIDYDKRLEKSPTLKVNKELIIYLVNHAEAIRDLVVAAEKAQEAMMVWTNTYAPEMCDPEGVKKSQELLNEGGTLYYIATVSQSLSEALAKLEEA